MKGVKFAVFAAVSILMAWLFITAFALQTAESLEVPTKRSELTLTGDAYRGSTHFSHRRISMYLA